MTLEQHAPPRRKVAIFEPYVFDTVYGNTRYVSTIFQYIDKNSFEPILISPIEGKFLNEIEAHGGRWIVLSAPRVLNRYGGALLNSGVIRKISAAAGLVYYWGKLAIRLLSERIDILQCHDERAMIFAGMAGKLARKPVIWYIKGQLGNPLLDRFSFAVADRILFQGETNMNLQYDKLVRKYRDKISILGNGIDLHEVAQAEQRDHAALKQELGFDDTAINIVFVGQVVRTKGLDELLQAMAELRKTTANANLYIVGDHCIDAYRGYRDELDAKIETLGLKNIIFTGWRKDVHDIVSIMDIFVLPSHTEGVPKSVIEAMALGKPVLTTDVGSVPDLVGNGQTGIVVPPRDGPALARELIRLVENSGLRQRLGDRARQFAHGECSIRKNIKGLEKIYRDLKPKNRNTGRLRKLGEIFSFR